MPTLSGREREARLIRQANRAAAVGRLMLGEVDSWNSFLRADTIDLERLSRRNLKSGKVDVQQRLSSEIKTFCRRNFDGMTPQKLSDLYEEVKAFRGLELPLAEFEARFARLRPEVLAGRPPHLTVSISLWGLQFKFPEEDIAKDLIEALGLAEECQTALRDYMKSAHSQVKAARDSVGALVRKSAFVSRTVVVNSYHLAEAYLNGVAWDYIRSGRAVGLSKTKQDLLEDRSGRISTHEKFIKYPSDVTGRPLFTDSDEDLANFTKTMIPYRHALVHPSPFSVPEQWGGYDKFRLFYRVDYDIAVQTVTLLMTLVKRVHYHVHGTTAPLLAWMQDLELALEKAELQ